MVSYDDNGFYGHPDHIQAHRVAWRAFELADGLVSKFYATAIPKSVLAEAMALLEDGAGGSDGGSTELGRTEPGSTELGRTELAGTDFTRVESVDALPFGTDDDKVTTRIDARDYLEAKLAAMHAHATQIAVDSPFFALSDMVGQRALGTEYYTLLAGPAWPGHGPGDFEPDLFAGAQLAGAPAAPEVD
jgi:N-acetyl-1-D-myo-inositol-2-amino-2-deoxy-alpha-D-glucopyranoside deacetylase